MACPMPVINTKKYFDSIEEGVAEVLVDNEVAKIISVSMQTDVDIILILQKKEGNYIIKIEKKW